MTAGKCNYDEKDTSAAELAAIEAIKKRNTALHQEAQKDNRRTPCSALHSIGLAYLIGSDGLPRNTHKATLYFKQDIRENLTKRAPNSTNYENISSVEELATIYLEDQNAPRNPSLAFDILVLAGRFAKFNPLAQQFETGDLAHSMPKDLGRALEGYDATRKLKKRLMGLDLPDHTHRLLGSVHARLEVVKRKPAELEALVMQLVEAENFPVNREIQAGKNLYQYVSGLDYPGLLIKLERLGAKEAIDNTTDDIERRKEAIIARAEAQEQGAAVARLMQNRKGSEKDR